MVENTVEIVDIDQLDDYQVEQLDLSYMSTSKIKKNTSGVWEQSTKESIVDLKILMGWRSQLDDQLVKICFQSPVEAPTIFFDTYRGVQCHLEVEMWD